MNKSLPKLSKSRFMEGMQCHKRLYLSLFNRELAAPVSDATQAIFDQGHRVGELACTRFPGGVLVSEDHTDHKGAMRSTEKTIADPGIPSFYEGAFRYDDIRIRADILMRGEKKDFDLVEVKSSTRVKPENEWDLAIQHYVLTGAGYTLGRSCLMHINNGYVYQGGEHDPMGLFTLADLTESTIEKQSAIPGLLEAMREKGIVTLSDRRRKRGRSRFCWAILRRASNCDRSGTNALSDQIVIKQMSCSLLC